MSDYLSYWSLFRKPFVFGAEQVFFAGTPQREAMAGLNFLAINGLGSAFLSSPPGCGASQLLRRVERMRGFGDRAAELILTDGHYSSPELVQLELCRGLGYQNADDDAASRIDRAIESASRQDVQVIWLIDQCRTASAQVARDLVSTHANCSVVIGSHPEQVGRLTVEFGRCGMQIDLPPLSLQDTIEYLKFGVDHAGGRCGLFPDDTAVRLHEITSGKLSDLSVTAESALALAASHQMDKVTPAVVEAIEEQVSRVA